jgi:hypothetical protein
MKIAPDTLIELTLSQLNLKYFKEYRFHEKRRWRFDYLVPELMTAIEIEGATFADGRHTRGKGYANDCEKYNNAQILGYKVLRYPIATLHNKPMMLYDDIIELRKRKSDND